MVFGRSEYEASQQAKKVQKIRSRSSELQAAKRSALSATQVTGDKHWDHFLSVVNERLGGLQKEMDVAFDLLKTSDNFSPEDLINQKLAVRLIGREIQALTWVIKLPQQLMEQGDLAKQLLGNTNESTH
jgi:hypothetical protein